jgi:CHAT domain-containing protein
MKRFPALLLIAPLLLLAVSLCPAQDQKQLDDLKALFERDPVAGFVEAQKMFEVPKRTGDVAGMLGIITIVKPWSQLCWYWAPCLIMAEAALPLATARGDWAAVGDLRWTQASLTLHPGTGWHRTKTAVDRATEAYARAGKEPPGFIAWQAHIAPKMYLGDVFVSDLTNGMQYIPADIRPTLMSFVEAVENADDSRASELMLELVRMGSEAPASNRVNLHDRVCGCLWLPGSERLLPELRRWIVEAPPEAQARMVDCLVVGCMLGWSGGQDQFLTTYQWCIQTAQSMAPPPSLDWIWPMPGKASRFGQTVFAVSLLRALLDLPLPAGKGARWSYAVGLLQAHPAMPADLRRALVAEQLESINWAMRDGSDLFPPDLGFPTWRIADVAPEAERATWCLETAYQIADYAGNFPTAETRSRAATEAAAYFTKGGRADLAAQATEMARVFAADDPKTKLACALVAAKAAAADGKWEDVVKGLEPVMSDAAPSGTAVQAALLVRQAQAALGKKDEADKWLSRAQELLTQAKLASSERAGFLMTLAELTPDPPRKLALLKQAEVAATEAGLAPLQEKISQQIAELALATGDLTGASKALHEIIDRLEAKREALAFDPVLRQQWFADNLGPYRKLLRVEARRQNAAEALWCAEKMRARALTDQLAWQKVDLGVRLPPELQERLRGLREMRTKTYALLQRAMGGEQLTGSDVRGAYMPVRGSYLPIRGAYLPIRGGLDDQPLTEADLAELRGLIDGLQKEEAALAGAIREQVPAYAAASDAPVLTGTRLIEKVLAYKDLVLLHYTLCDDGLVVVACGPGSRPKVVLIPVKGDDLWQQIGQLRQDIWERKPEVTMESMKLYNQLVAPVEGCFYGAKRILVVADGALQLLPFGVLTGTDRNYLVSRFAIATTPSLSLAISSRGQRPPGQGTVILAAPDTGAIALPETEDKRGAYMPIRGMYMPVRGAYLPIRGEGVSTALTAMAMVPLPGAKAEGEAIAAQFQPSALLTDKQATKAKLIEAGGKCDLLHIATHGYADPEYPEFSGLLLAGEKDAPYDTLTAQEVYMWQLKARLVTLSACQTAMGKTVEGEGVMGLTRAFIYAGAQDVLCTLWPVADESTKALMTAFYTNLKTSSSIEEALRGAQSTLAGNRETSHPFFWAGFVAVRGPE